MKKVLALTLVLVLAISMSTMAFAAPKIEKEFDYKEAAKVIMNSAQNGGVDPLDGNALKDIVVKLQSAWFTMDDGSAFPASPASTGTDVEPRALSKYNIGVNLRWTKGSQVLDEAKIDTKTGELKVIFEDQISTIKNIDYKFQILMTVDGRTISDSDKYLEFEGTYEPTKDETDADWYNFDGTRYFQPSAFIRNMEFTFDDQFSVFGRALKGVKYYGKLSTDVNDDDEELMIAHPEIVAVYHITQIGVASVAERVSFLDEDSSLHVYGVGSALNYTGDVLAASSSNLVYLGKVGDKNLPFYETYYLAAAQFDTDEELEPEEEEEEEEYEPGEWGGNAGTGGDDLYPENPHDNPGTGK